MIRRLMNNRTAANASWIILGKIAQSFVALLINMLTARYLGPSNYGLISYAASIVAFVVPIMNLGLNSVLVQETTNHPEEEGLIFGTSIILSLVSAVCCIIGVISFSLVVDAGETVTNYVVGLYSLQLVFQAFELIQYWFQAKLLSKFMSASSLAAYMVVAVYKVYLLASGASVYFFAVSNSLDYMLIAAALFVVYRKLGGMKLRFSGAIAARMFASSKHYIVSNLMVTIFAQTDRIMLKFMIGEASVGYYSAAVSCAALTTFVFTAIIDSMRPSIYANKRNGNEAAYERGIERTYCLVIYLAMLQSVVMTLFARLIVSVLYGKSFAPSVSALQIVVWYTTFSYMGAVRNIWILGENKQKYLWILNLGGACANIILNAFLIPTFGVNGAALASLITQFFTNVVMNAVVWPLKYNNTLIKKGMNPWLVLELLKK